MTYDTRVDVPLPCGCLTTSMEVIDYGGGALSKGDDLVVTANPSAGVLGVYEVVPGSVKHSSGLRSFMVRVDGVGEPILFMKSFMFVARCSNHPSILLA